VPAVIDTVIMDLDGPVLDGRLRHYACYRDILTEHGLTPLAEAPYWEMKRHRLDRRRQLAATGADHLYDEFLDTWLARIESGPYLALDRLQPGVMNKLDEWRTAGIRLLLVTMRHNRDSLLRQLDALNLRTRFDAVLSVGPTEPDAGKAAAVRPYLDANAPKRALWVGDTEVDVRAARRVGTLACAVTCGLRTEEYLASLSPDMVLRDVNAISLHAVEVR
jgi:phosphoglycolate phosphatase-like HAD superfamily hydrolase